MLSKQTNKFPEDVKNIWAAPDTSSHAENFSFKDFDNQADICEIVRAAVAKNVFKFKDLNMQSIPENIVNKIDCVGTNDRRGPRICAATGTSYYQRDSWSVFLNPSYIKVILYRAKFLVFWKTEVC